MSDSEKSYYHAMESGVSSSSYLKQSQVSYNQAKYDRDKLVAKLDKLNSKSFFSIKDRAEADALGKQLEEADAKYKRYEEELGFAKKWYDDDTDVRWEEEQYENGKDNTAIANGLANGISNLEAQRQALIEQRKAAQNGSHYVGEMPTYGESKQESAIKNIDEQIANLDATLEAAYRRMDRARGKMSQDPMAASRIAQGKELAGRADLDFLKNFSVTGDAASQSDFASWQLNNPNGTVEDYGRTILADRRPNENWTREQEQQFYILQSTAGQDAADKFAVSVNRALNDKARADATANWEKAGRGFDMSKEARENRSFLGNLGAGVANVAAGIGDIGISVAAAPAHLFNWLDRMYQNQQHGGYYAGNDTPYITDYTDTAVAARAKALNEDYSKVRFNIPVAGQKGLGDMYQLAQSMAQSLAYGNIVGEGATLVAFFGQAADQAYQEAEQRGYSPEQAAISSFLSGVAEVMAEKIGLDHLLDADAALTKSTVRFLLEQAGLEGAEEGITDILNIFGDALAANLTGGEADIDRKVRLLMQQSGYGYEQALREVWKEQAKETAWSVAGGFLSGAGSGFVQSGGNILAEHQQKRATEKFKKNANDLLQNLKPEQIAGYSEYDLQRLKNLAENLGKTDAAETIQKVIDQKKAEAAAQNQAGEAEEGPSFGKRLVDEASEKEPELQGSLRVLFELDNETFERNLRWFDKNEKVLRDMHEWALWNEEFDKADIIKNMAKASGFDLNKTASEATEEKAPPPGDEEAPPPPADNDISPASSKESEQTQRSGIDLTPSEGSQRRANALDEETRDGLKAKLADLQQKLKDNPELAKDENFVKQVSDVFNEINSALDSVSDSEAEPKNSTVPTESGTIEPESKSNNPLVNESKEANNGGKQAVREPEAGTAGVQSTPAAEGRREGAVAEPQAERPVESAENRGSSEAPGQAAEDVPRAERGSRKNEKGPRKVKPKWLTSEQDSSDFDKWQSGGKSTGKRAPAPMGKDVLDLKKNGGTGVIQTLPGTQIIEVPDVGTVAHMVFKILDAFNVKNHQRHVYSTKYFANFGSDGQLGVIKGVNNGGQVAVAVDETADIPVQQNAIKTAIHECTHRNFGKKFGTNGSRAKVSSVDTGEAITVDSVTVEQRSEYTYKKLIECFVKAGFSESGARAGISEITEFWLNEADENGNGGFGYAAQYDVDGTRKQYADSVSGLNLGSELLESVVRAALQKRVSEEMLVDLTCNSPKIAALVREGVISYEDSLKLKDAALNALAADGVLQQKEVDAINVAFEAMQNFEFVEASLSSTGSSDSNISQPSEPQRSSYTPAIRFVEKDFNANRSKKAQPNPNEGKSPPKKVKTVEHDSVVSAAKAISGIKTVFEGGTEGFPDVIAIDRNGRTYTIPENVKSAVKQVKNAVRGIGEGKHPMRSLSKLIQLYDNFAAPGSDMARFTTDEINQAIADIKEIGNSKTLSDNQKIMRLETATTRALNLIGAQMRNVNEAFEMDFEIAKLIAGDGKSAVRNKLARGFLAKTASGVNEAYSVWKSLQLNPTTMFKMIGKFDKASGNAGYKIANKIERATAISQMNYAIAMQEFNELRNMKGFNEFATNKTKCSVKLGDIELTEQEAVDFIKRVNTLKATVIGGKSRLSTIKGFTIKGSDGKYVYIDSKAVKSKWADIASSMEKSLSPVAKAYMDAASKALYDLGGKVSEMKRNTTGVGFWTMEKGIYYPLQYHSPSHEDVSLDSEITNFFGPTGASVTLQRTRDEGGYVVIQPSALTVDNYINRASSYTGFGQLATQLGIMDAPGAGLNGLSNMVANNFGKQYGKVVRNYVNDMNNVMRAESGFNKLARKLRMNLQKGALMTSVSVPIKQVASYWNAIGVLSPEAVTKAYRFKLLRAKGSGAENMLLAYRTVGGIDPTVSEVLNNKDFLRGLKKKAKIIDTFDKAISIMDYRTVDNLYAATVLDVKATFPDVDVNSEEFARLVNAKFEEVVINTQPIYTALARSESQRTNNEIIRNLSTFRTQQTQNFNRLVTTLGEARAAKGTVGELLADKALKQTIGGQIAAQVEFGLLGVLADLVLHRWKKYRRDDDEDKFDVGKFAERWFINTVESAAGTAWLGDQAAKWAIDRIAKAVNDDTDIHEFYGVSVGALSTLKQTYDSFGYLMDKPSVYNVKRFVVNLSTICGMPIGNLYNNANALIMWGASILGENPDKYDDVIKYVFGEETKKDKENRKADKLYQAVADGNTEKANKLFEYYGSKADANEQIAGAIMRRYQAGKLGKEAAVNELREYADMSKYDAEHYINEATAKLELGYEYSKIKDKYQSGEITRQEALSYRQKYGSESAKDAEAEVQKWTMEVDTGYDYSDLEKHFAAGDVTKEDAIRYRVKYGGEDREDAEKTVAHWQCEVDTDIPYSEITDYYVSGEISKSKLISYYQKYGLYDAEKAQEKADVAQFIWDKKDQLGDATAAAVRGYNNYCGDLGIDKEFYLSNYFAINKVEGVKNSKGKTVSGSVVTNKIKYIDNLNLTPAQKTAIANACNIELKSLKKYHAPWL